MRITYSPATYVRHAGWSWTPGRWSWLVGGERGPGKVGPRPAARSWGVISNVVHDIALGWCVCAPLFYSPRLSHLCCTGSGGVLTAVFGSLRWRSGGKGRVLYLCASLISGVCEFLYVRPVIYRQGGDVEHMRAHLLTYGLEVTVLHVALISKAEALGINLECGLSGGWRAAQPFWAAGSTAWPATWVSADPSVNHNSGGIKAGGGICSNAIKYNFGFPK